MTAHSQIRPDTYANVYRYADGRLCTVILPFDPDGLTSYATILHPVESVKLSVGFFSGLVHDGLFTPTEKPRYRALSS